MNELNSRVLKLLKKIEWKGGYDYSIGVRECPCCSRRPPLKSWKGQGHSEVCELSMVIEDLEELISIQGK